MMLDEPQVIEPHLIGKNALLHRFGQHFVVVQAGPLHLVLQCEFHIPSSFRVALLSGILTIASIVSSSIQNFTLSIPFGQTGRLSAGRQLLRWIVVKMNLWADRRFVITI